MANGHGGQRQNSGRPKKPLSEAIVDGTRPSRLKFVKFEGVELANEELPTIPEVKEYLKAAQKDDSKILAEGFFIDIWNWLVERKCEKLFDINYLQRFAMQQARYVQLENQVSKFGFLAKSTSGEAIENPLEKILQSRLKLLNQMQYYIEANVKANCTVPYDGFVNFSDPMEELLRGY